MNTNPGMYNSLVLVLNHCTVAFQKMDLKLEIGRRVEAERTFRKLLK